MKPIRCQSQVRPTMNRPRVLRIARITWTVGCLTAAMLLCVVWVRSYSWLDAAMIHVTNNYMLGVATCQRGLAVATGPVPKVPRILAFEVQSVSLDDPSIIGLDVEHVLKTGAYGRYLIVPYAVLGFIVGLLTVTPWLPLRHFSLRTLVLGVTLGSILLGLVAWASRS